MIEVRIRRSEQGYGPRLCMAEFSQDCGEIVVAALKRMGGVYIDETGGTAADFSYQIVLEDKSAYLEIIVHGNGDE